MSKYKLKKGVFIRQIGLPPLCEWKLTDELAESYLKNDPSVARFFAFIPEKKEPVKKTISFKNDVPEPAPEMEIVSFPEKHEIEKPKRKRYKTKE